MGSKPKGNLFIAVIVVFVGFILIAVIAGLFLMMRTEDGTGATPSVQLPTVGEWSDSVQLNGCRVTFKEGHGEWYEIQYRIFGQAWSNHVKDEVEPMNEFRYKLLDDVEVLPYRFKC